MKIKELEIICKKVIEDNPIMVKEYKSGKIALIGTLTGLSMIKSEATDPKTIVIILKELLK